MIKPRGAGYVLPAGNALSVTRMRKAGRRPPSSGLGASGAAASADRRCRWLIHLTRTSPETRNRVRTAEPPRGQCLRRYQHAPMISTWRPRAGCDDSGHAGGKLELTSAPSHSASPPSRAGASTSRCSPASSQVPSPPPLASCGTTKERSVTAECTHERFVWFSSKPNWSEKDADLHRHSGHWECRICVTALKEPPMGRGYCRSCQKPIDDHEYVGTGDQRCPRRS